MSKFAQEMEPVADPKHVKDDLDAPLEANVHSQFRGGVGQLQWLQLQGNPLLLFATGILQSISATPNGHDLLSLNKLLREAKIDAGSLLVDCISASGLYQCRHLSGSRPQTQLGQIALMDHPRVVT